MSLISQEATYRGVILDGGLSESSGGYPQEVLKLKATEVYDTDSGEWLPADPENNEITWYGVLFSKGKDGRDKELPNNKQLVKITGGYESNFNVLAEMVLIDLPIQFRVEPDEYNGNTTLKVVWIDVFDAVPGRTIQKLDKAGVAALQQRYATVLAATKAPAKAVSALVSTPKTAPVGNTPITGDKGTTPTVKTRGRPKGKPTIPGKAAPVSATPVGRCTPDAAWDACISLKRDDITEQKLGEIWTEEVYKINNDPDALTLEQWFIVKTNVQKQTSKV